MNGLLYPIRSPVGVMAWWQSRSLLGVRLVSEQKYTLSGFQTVGVKQIEHLGLSDGGFATQRRVDAP